VSTSHQDPPDGVEITVGYKALPGLQDRSRSAPSTPAAGDPLPWDANTQFTTVGSDLDRVDGLAKATGRAKYSYDITFPGLLQAMILRSPVARGKLTGARPRRSARDARHRRRRRAEGDRQQGALRRRRDRRGRRHHAARGARRDREDPRRLRTPRSTTSTTWSPTAPRCSATTARSTDEWPADADLDAALAKAADDAHRHLPHRGADAQLAGDARRRREVERQRPRGLDEHAGDVRRARRTCARAAGQAASTSTR
jgi:hypothetical protein